MGLRSLAWGCSQLAAFPWAAADQTLAWSRGLRHNSRKLKETSFGAPGDYRPGTRLPVDQPIP